MVIPLSDTNPSIGAKNYWAAAAGWPWWMQWLIFTIISLVLYIPVLGNTFVSDDWLVLKRLTMDGRLNTKGFFRPLSDMTIWLNYQLGGLNAFNYYLFGIILRGLSAMLLYQFCLRWPWAEGDARKYVFSAIAALLFVTYPFHNEPVAWILGRGALMAGIMTIAALLILTTRYKHVWKITGICLCYFVGLLAYESILVLPMMVLVYLFATYNPFSQIRRYLIFLALTLSLHIVLRMQISGSVTGDYGGAFLEINIAGFFANGLKAMLRSFTPPQPGLSLAIIIGFLLLLAWVVLTNRLQKTLGPDNRPKVLYFIITVCWLFALVIPSVGAVSVRTSESDRFLELPAYFLCMMVAHYMTFLQKRRKALHITLFIILAYNIFFLEKNNFNWTKASDIVKETLQLAKNNDGNGKLYFYNIPGQINGAYVFRIGFEEALLLNGVDTSRVQLLDKEPILRLPADRVYSWNGLHWTELK